MNHSDGPLPADCARCPLRLPLPDDLSDAALAQLVETLYLFAAAIENGCYSRLRRYWATQRELDNSTISRHPHQRPTTTSPMTTCRSDRPLALHLMTMPRRLDHRLQMSEIPPVRESRPPTWDSPILRRSAPFPVSQTAATNTILQLLQQPSPGTAQNNVASRLPREKTAEECETRHG